MNLSFNKSKKPKLNLNFSKLSANENKKEDKDKKKKGVEKDKDKVKEEKNDKNKKSIVSIASPSPKSNRSNSNESKRSKSSIKSKSSNDSIEIKKNKEEDSSSRNFKEESKLKSSFKKNNKDDNKSLNKNNDSAIDDKHVVRFKDDNKNKKGDFSIELRSFTKDKDDLNIKIGKLDINNNDDEKRLAFKKQKMMENKIKAIELNELKESNSLRLESIKEKLYFDVDAKNEVIQYIQKTGNLDTRNRKFPVYIILPNSMIKRIWNIVVLLFSIYSIIIIPIDVGWNLSCLSESSKRINSIMSLLTPIVFLTNIGMNFITAILDEKFKYLFSIKDIFIQYVKTYFIFDLLSAMPYEFFVKFNEKDCFNPNSSNTRIILVVALVRAVGASKMFEVIEDIFPKMATRIRLLKLFIMILYFAHCNGNIIVGNSESLLKIVFENCNGLNSIEEVQQCRKTTINEKFFDIYTYCIYIGYFIIAGNEMKLYQSGEKIYFLVISIISIRLMANIYGNVAILITKLSYRTSPVVQEKIDIMKEYMKYMKFEKSFVDIIESYHVNIWSKQRSMLYSENFYDDMNVSLHKMILIDQWNSNFFSISKWLNIISDEAFSNIITHLKPKIYMKNDIIITEGDFSYDIYFSSNKGNCSVKVSGQLVKNMDGGELFGEISIFLRSMRRTATVTSLNDSDFLLLEGKEYEIFLQNYPNVCAKIKETGINRLMSSIKFYPSNVYIKLVPNNDLKDYLIRKSIYLNDYEEDQYYKDNKNTFVSQNIIMEKVQQELERVKTNIQKCKISLSSSLSDIKKKSNIK